MEKTIKVGGSKAFVNEGTEEKSDFSSITAKIKLQRPDAMYFGGIYTQIGIFIGQLRDEGIAIPAVGGAGLDSPGLATIAAKGANSSDYITMVAPLRRCPPPSPSGPTTARRARRCLSATPLLLTIPLA